MIFVVRSRIHMPIIYTFPNRQVNLTIVITHKSNNYYEYGKINNEKRHPFKVPLLYKERLCYYSLYFLKMMAALWPPKPNVLDKTALTSFFTALLKVKLRS